MRIVRGGVLLAVAGPVAVVGAYLLAAVALASLPVDGRPAVRNGVEIFVCTNGVHTDLVLPAANGLVDWTTDLRHGDFPGTGPWASHVSFGWGDRAFYLETRQWSDLRLSTALSALFGGGPSVMHVYAMPRPAGSPDCGALRLGNEAYRALAAFVRGSFRRDGAGRVIPLPGSGYGATDLFYEAVGHYSPVETCNEWTGKALRAAGVTVGAWTPFEGSVMRWVR
ncbi:TIGR02117 family protein [Azospirillum isscasi]|uniref:TIGR02117 family protein n=1 Tax=Azospirillum isscasi TaxID=3053926 RepID=A0ABU0WP64_9PROT|nr:TIGR02117 family protein [Azospirillum isscasi]MDQ2105622.1 TIGR02117 family protein [Azospirillum isscasi]